MTAPSVPKHIIEAIVAYGDARADGLTGSTHIVDAIQGIRDLLASPQSSDEQPRYNYGPDGKGPVSLLNGDHLNVALGGERAAFESAFENVQFCSTPDSGGKYRQLCRKSALDGWQARARLAEAPTVSGYVCAECKAALRPGYTCDVCGSDEAEDAPTPPAISAAVPDGWRLVPQYLTKPMKAAGEVVAEPGGKTHYGFSIRALELAWRAMLAAAPTPPTSAAEEPFEMPLCESRKVTLQIGRAYRFVPVDYCDACQAMRREHDEAYGVKS